MWQVFSVMHERPAEDSRTYVYPPILITLLVAILGHFFEKMYTSVVSGLESYFVGSLFIRMLYVINAKNRMHLHRPQNMDACNGSLNVRYRACMPETQPQRPTLVLGAQVRVNQASTMKSRPSFDTAGCVQ